MMHRMPLLIKMWEVERLFCLHILDTFLNVVYRVNGSHVVYVKYRTQKSIKVKLAIFFDIYFWFNLENCRTNFIFKFIELRWFEPV